MAPLARSLRWRIGRRASAPAPLVVPLDPVTRYDAWLQANELNARRRSLLAEEAEALPNPPLLSIVVTGGASIDGVEQALAGQIYRQWELPGKGEPLRGDYVAFVDAADALAPDALAEVALQLAASPRIDVLYTDDDEVAGDGSRSSPRFKPDWSPELLLSTEYVGGLLVVRRALLAGIPASVARHELLLRLAELTDRFAHVPRVLYHRRAGSEVDVQATPPFPDDGPRVAVLVPTRNRVELLSACLDSLRSTSYRNYEVVVVDNESDDPATLHYLERCPETVLRIDTQGRFDFAQLLNRAVAAVDAEYILFLNNDTEVVHGRWLAQMVGYLGRAGVGAVGARLLFPDRTIQHAGVIHGLAHGLAGHAFAGLPEDDSGYLSYAALPRNCSAVTGACLLTRREVFLELGGFDEARFPVSYNDVDFCYRLVDAGHRIVYCPDAELIHHEGVSRGRNLDPGSPSAFRALHGQRVDPYYNPNLSLENGCYLIGTRTVPRSRHAAMRVACTGGLDDILERLGSDGVIEPLTAPVTEERTYEATVLALVERLRALRADVVHATGLGAFAAVDAASRAGLPSLWSLHEGRDWRAALAALPAQAVQTAVHCLGRPYQIVFDADRTRSAWREVATRHNTIVVPNAIDVTRLRSSLVARDVARRRLGLEPAEIAAVWLEGRPPDRPPSGLRVLEPTSLGYSAADLGVCAVPLETYSPTMLEAMAAGLALVTPQVPEVGHEVSSGVNALTYEPHDESALARAVESLVADEQERNRLAGNSPRVLAALPTFEARVRTYASLFREAWLVAGPRL